MVVQLPVILAKALASNVGPQPQAPAASADEAQAARFRELLHTDGTNSAEPALDPASASQSSHDGLHASAELAATVASGAGVAASHPASLGDAILHGLDKVRNTLKEGWTSAAALIEPQSGPVSTGRLLQFEVGVLHVGFQQQLVGSIAAKTAQNIDQLVKMQ